MPTRRTITSRKRNTTTSKYIVTGKFVLESKPVTKTQADGLIKKIRANGGTATKRKV